MADAVGAACDRVDGGAVVGEELLDGDAVAVIELDRAVQEANGGRRFLVRENLGVGQTRGVVDRDVYGIPAGL